MKPRASLGYAISAHTQWVVEQKGVVLIHALENRCTWLAYPEAAVWDLLTRDWSRREMISMLAVIAAVDEAAAEILLDGCLERWTHQGWLTREVKP